MVWHGVAVIVVEWAQVVPHSHVVDKNQEGYLGSEQSQAREYNPGFQSWECKFT